MKENHDKSFSDPFVLGDVSFDSRLMVGTGKYRSDNLIPDVLRVSGAQMITLALRRAQVNGFSVLEHIPKHIRLLPNTAGATTAQEAVRIAHIAREAGMGNFIKIEVIPDPVYLLPDNQATVEATSILAKEGFVVLPYVLPDPIIAKQLANAGAAAIMPLGSPIGSNLGLQTKPLIRLVIEQSHLPVIVDAGLGQPSHAAEAMEMGAAAVLVNTAIATAQDPVRMAEAFGLAVRAGRLGFLAKARTPTQTANASSPTQGVSSMSV
jgi:thiazole synthase